MRASVSAVVIPASRDGGAMRAGRSVIASIGTGAVGAGVMPSSAPICRPSAARSAVAGKRSAKPHPQ
jgi:hypothetical protein